MSWRLFLIVVVLIVSACTSVPSSPAPQATPAPAIPAETTEPSASTDTKSETGFQPGGVVITLVRSGGLAGKIVRWEVYGGGRITSSMGPEATVTAEQVQAVVSEIERLGFFELSGQSRMGGKCADCYIYELTVRTGAKDRTLTFVPQASGTPAQVLQIMEQVNSLLAMLPQS